MSKALEDYAFRLGRSARISLKDISACPYVFGSPCRGFWEDGWKNADYELRSAKRSH